MNSPKGTFDILPLANEFWQQSHLWRFFEENVYASTKIYGFEEIRTPIFERTELFLRGVGESSDIVSKEMYTFEDKGGRSMTLRPELTASVMRSFIEHHLEQKSPLHKFFYMGPIFRYDRPQSGRYRQFHQMGAEIIGGKSPLYDAEIIDLSLYILQRLGLTNLNLFINSVGETDSRRVFSQALKDYLPEDQLSEDSRKRLSTNPLRILDSKDPGDQALLENAPKLTDFLGSASQDRLHLVQEQLKKWGHATIIHPRLVRGLDYYNETVFEITAGGQNAQNALCGGGRYDGLLKLLGGADLPGVGFAIGIERVIQALIAQKKAPTFPGLCSLFLVSLGDAAKSLSLNLLKDLRRDGISVVMDYTGKKIKDQLKMASDYGCKYALIIGDEEIISGQAELKNLASRESKKISWQNKAILKGDLI
ncbi:MAG: histidine--tRNA ligase [Chlamydiae bacterium]|nr:histidine--tRNA ligase [Chlamydiota bacterium]